MDMESSTFNFVSKAGRRSSLGMQWPIGKGSSIKDVREIGRGQRVIWELQTNPDKGEGWFSKLRTSENLDQKFSFMK